MSKTQANLISIVFLGITLLFLIIVFKSCDSHYAEKCSIICKNNKSKSIGGGYETRKCYCVIDNEYKLMELF